MVIAISHQKGGVGKSTVAFNLAVELSKLYEVELIDLDVQETVSAYNRIRNIMGQKQLKICTFNNDKSMINYINNLVNNKLVIIDTGGFDSAMNRISIAIADYLITPVSSEFTEVLGLEKYKQILEEISKQIGRHVTSNILLNKINPQQKHFNEIIEFIESSKHFNLMESKLRRRVDFSNSVAHGFTVSELDDQSESSKELKFLLNEVIKKAGLDDK